MRAFVGAVLVVLLAACSSSAKSTAPPASTTTTPTTVAADCTPARPAPKAAKQYTFGGRTYSLALPNDYDGRRAVPVIFGFHGHGASKELFEIDTKLAAKGTDRGYAVVLVDGSGDPKTWRMFAFDGPASDYTQVAKLVQHIEQQLCIDQTRVFAAGHSAGSAFTGFLVCRKPYLFAGAAMVSATIPNLCADDISVATIGVHGVKDPVVLYDGGKGIGQEAAIPPFADTIAKTAAKSGCTASPPVEHPIPAVDRRVFEDCAVPVESITLEQGSHPWPGGFQATHTEPVPPGATYDATAAILAFFDRVH